MQFANCNCKIFQENKKDCLKVPTKSTKHKYSQCLTFPLCPLCFKWSTPLEILHSYQAEELWIAPPQFYELSRFCRFPLLNDLHNFSVQRATEGCEQWLPLISKDEHSRPVSLLPGAHSPSYISIEEKKNRSHQLLLWTEIWILRCFHLEIRPSPLTCVSSLSFPR